jgi:predicted RNA-binding protein YlqC (UPF0109 family)
MAAELHKSANDYLELVRYLMATMVPEVADRVVVDTQVSDDQLRLTVRAPEGARGKLIGRGGRTVRALRTLVEQAAIEGPYKVTFDIQD